MKKNIIYTFAASVLMFMACEDHREDDLSEDKMYLPRSGYVEEISYAVGETTTLDLWAHRSGLNNSSCQVNYVLNEKLLNDYNAENGTTYKLLPSNCYKLTDTHFTISGDDEYARFQVSYFPEEIVKLGNYNVVDYVLPFEINISGLEGTVGKTTSLVGFKVKEALLKLTSEGIKESTAASGTATFDIDVPFGVDFTNKWDINLTFSSNDALVDLYNLDNGTDYLAFPAGSYKLTPTTPVLKAGEKSASARYTIDVTKLKLGSKYLLPVELADASKFGVDTEHRLSYYGLEYVDARIDQTAWEIADFRDTEEGDGAGPTALIDDDIDTYWHAKWSIGSLLPSWITIKLKDKDAVVKVSQVELYARQGNTSGPKTVEILTSMDGQNWTLGGTLAFKSVKTAQKIIFKEPVLAKYVKMNITEKNNNSVAMGEMYVRGVLQ